MDLDTWSSRADDLPWIERRVSECMRRLDDMTVPLRSFQRNGVEWMLKRELAHATRGVPGGILADDMGLGKTAQMLALVRANPGDGATLIVCPKPLEKQWRDECLKFLGEDPLIVSTETMHRGNLPDTVGNAKVVIAPYSSFYGKCTLLLETNFRRIVVDEAHNIKNHTSRLYIALLEVCATHRWCVTGTPVVSSRKTTFSSEVRSLVFFLIVRRGTWDDAKDIAKDESVMRQLLMRRTKKDVLSLPGLTIDTVSVDFTKEERRVHAQLHLRGRHSVSSKGGPDQGQLLAILCKMQQTCTCVSKLQAIVKDVVELPAGTKSIVFCKWIRDIDTVREMLVHRGVPVVMELCGSMSHAHKIAAQREFEKNDGSSKCIVVQIDLGGTGLNLQVASRVFICTPHWNASTELQAIGRAHRIGTKHAVNATRYVVANSIEDHVHRIQMQKLEAASAVLRDDAIKDMLPYDHLPDVDDAEVMGFFSSLDPGDVDLEIEDEFMNSQEPTEEGITRLRVDTPEQLEYLGALAPRGNFSVDVSREALPDANEEHLWTVFDKDGVDFIRRGNIITLVSSSPSSL